MGEKLSPWYEAWFIKVLAIVAGAGVIYGAQVAYEKGLRHGFGRRRAPLNSAPRDFGLVAQLDFGGKTVEKRRDQLKGALPALRLTSISESLANIRGLICLLTPPFDTNQGDIDQDSVSTQPSWSFEVMDDNGESTELYPMPTPGGSVLCLRMPYSTPEGFRQPVLVVKSGDSVISRIPLRQIAPLPEKKIGRASDKPPIEVTASEIPIYQIPITDRSSFSVLGLSQRPVRYRVQLTSSIPKGEEVFARLVTTEYESALEDSGWTEFHGNQATLSSPCGLLAKKAKIELAYTVPTHLSRSIRENLGKVLVQFRQPMFVQPEPRSFSVTDTANLNILPQGELLRRPPTHPKRSILIYAVSGRISMGSSDVFPDSVDHVQWLGPNPAVLGLDQIRTPWETVRAAQPVARTVHEGALTADLKVWLTRRKVVGTETVVAPIRNVSADWGRWSNS